MRIGKEHCCSRQLCRQCRRSSVLRTKRKRREREILVDNVREKARHASERSVSEIVEDPETCAQRRAPISYSTELISKSDSRSNVSVDRFIQRRAARRECHRRWIIQPGHCE